MGCDKDLGSFLECLLSYNGVECLNIKPRLQLAVPAYLYIDCLGQL